jgi:hypothetical protein
MLDPTRKSCLPRVFAALALSCSLIVQVATGAELGGGAVSSRSAGSSAANYDANADWQRRSRGQGVIVAVGFDHIDEWAKYSFDRDKCNPDYQKSTGSFSKAGCRNNAWDSRIRASGAGSVRFDILSQTHQGAGGSMAIPFGDFATHQFGANSEFWVSWRQRMDARYIAGYRAAGGGGRYANAKQVIIAQGDIPAGDGKKLISGNACSEAEVVVVSSNPGGRAPYPMGYIECGRYVSFEQVLPRGSFAGDPRGSMPLTRQNMRRNAQGQFTCIGHPDSLDQSGCFTYRPDTWIIYMVHLKLGPEGRAVSSVSRKEQPGYINSTYELYAAYDGEDFQLLHQQQDVVIPKGQHYVGGDPLLPSSYKSGYGPADGHPQAKFGKLWLLPYMTNKDQTEVTPTASTWFDEVIVSRCRIPAPGQAAPRECNPVGGQLPTTATTGQGAAAPADRRAVVRAESVLPPRSPPPPALAQPVPSIHSTKAAGLSALQLATVISNLPPGQWFEIPGSAMDGVKADACKVKEIRDAYERVIKDMAGCNSDRMMSYSGGAYDSKRHRLLVWGGGHSTYAGNELYAFDLAAAKWIRLTEPSPPVLENALDAERKVMQPQSPHWHDPKFPPAPISVHSYDQLEYLPDQDMFFAAGGATYSANGYASGLAWLFDLNRSDASGWSQSPMPGKAYGLFEFNMSTAYDPVSGRVLMRGYSEAGSFDPKERTWNITQRKLRSRGLGTVGEIDPKRRVFIVIGGGGAELYRVSPNGEFGEMQPLATSGDKEIEQCYAPGLTFDAKADRFVAWCGKGDVYSLNLEKRLWVKHAPKSGAIPSDPADTPGIRGTYGRFRYMPEYNAFVLVSGIHSNVFVYRLADDKGRIP